MATLEELLAEKERRASATAAVPSEVAPEQATLEELIAEKERRVAAAPRYATDPELTPERVAEMGELTDIGAMLEGRERGFLDTVGENVSQALLNATTTDPMELADILTSRFGDDVEVRLSPDGVPIARNKHTGHEVAINRPGLSPMDIFQTIGLIGAYSPAARLTGMAKGFVGRAAAGMTTASATEAAIQAGQEQAGGEFDPEDVALSGAFGVVPEVVAKPIVSLGAKAKELIKPQIPESVTNALRLAKDRGKEIATSDAVWSTLTPFQQAAFGAAKRIPIFGTGKQQARKTAQRLDLFGELAEEYGIDITTDLGEEISDSVLKKMVNKRFWGKNKDPSLEQIDKAFKAEADDVSDRILRQHVSKGQVDAEVVDSIFNAGRKARVQQLFDVLDPAGQEAARKRLILEGLVDAGWSPGAPAAAKSEAFFKYLDKRSTRNSIGVLFSKEEQAVLDGAREYLRMTGRKTTESSAGASLATAALILSSPVSGPLIRLAETPIVRNLFIRFSHAKGKPELQEAIMRQLRPAVIALTKQYNEGNIGVEDLNVDITTDMIKGKSNEAMQYLRSLGEPGGEGEGVTQRLQEMLQ